MTSGNEGDPHEGEEGGSDSGTPREGQSGGTHKGAVRGRTPPPWKLREPLGWVCAGSPEGDLGRSSPGSGKGMTSLGQALIGCRSAQVGAAWPGRPQTVL